MRLWHTSLIPQLDGMRLVDQHRTCCCLRGNGWGKKNILLNFVFEDPNGEEALYLYHMEVIKEMNRRSFSHEPLWERPDYCGKNRSTRQVDMQCLANAAAIPNFYRVMDDAYLRADIARLEERGARPYVGTGWRGKKDNSIRP